MNFIDRVQEFLRETADVFNVGEHQSAALFLIVVSAALIIVFGLIALGIRSASAGRKFKKHLENTTAYLEANETDVDNVDKLNAYIQDDKMARSVKKGWGAFLDQQTGYPSDYISEAETFGDRKLNPDYKGGSAFFWTIGVVISLISAVLGVVAYWDEVAAGSISSLEGIKLVLPAILCLAVPFAVTIVGGAILGAMNRSLYKKTRAAFEKFADALDSSVIIFREPEDEFISENIEEINAAIDDIIAGKLGDSEILEIVTAPEIEESSVVEEAPAPEPIVTEPEREEAAADVAPEPEPEPETDEMDEELMRRRQQALLQIVILSDRATRDPSVSEQDLIDLATYLDDTMTNGEFTDEERQLFMRCYFILQARYFEMIGRPDLINPID